MTRSNGLQGKPSNNKGKRKASAKRAPLTIRITQELRDMLEREADNLGVSLQQVCNERLSVISDRAN